MTRRGACLGVGVHQEAYGAFGYAHTKPKISREAWSALRFVTLQAFYAFCFEARMLSLIFILGAHGNLHGQLTSQLSRRRWASIEAVSIDKSCSLAALVSRRPLNSFKSCSLDMT